MQVSVKMQMKILFWFRKKLYLDPELDKFAQDTPLGELTMSTRKPDTLVRIKTTVVKILSNKDITKHNVTHIPHMHWCAHCVEGRMKKDHALTVSTKERAQRRGIIVQADFFEFHGLRVLAMVEKKKVATCLSEK